MSTHVPGLRCFFLHHFLLAKLATSNIRFNHSQYLSMIKWPDAGNSKRNFNERSGSPIEETTGAHDFLYSKSIQIRSWDVSGA